MSDPISRLTLDTNLLVLEFLGPADFANCCVVSKKWKEIADSNEGLRSVFKNIINIPKDVNVKEFLSKSFILFDKIPSQIKEFINKLQLNQKGQFKCLFVSDLTQHHFSLSCGFSDFKRGLTNNSLNIDEKRICLKRVPPGNSTSSILSTDNDYRYGRLERTYIYTACPSNHIPFKNIVRNALQRRFSEFKESKRIDLYFKRAIQVALIAVAAQFIISD